MPADFADGGNSILAAYPDALLDLEKLLTTYVGSSTVGFCILDSELRYLAINETLARMNGVPARDHLGKTAREVLGSYADLVEPQLTRAVSSGQPVTFEVPGRPRSKEEARYWIVHYIPIRNETGAVTRIGTVVVDVTEQKNWRSRSTTSPVVSRIRWSGFRCSWM